MSFRIGIKCLAESTEAPLTSSSAAPTTQASSGTEDQSAGDPQIELEMESNGEFFDPLVVGVIQPYTFGWRRDKEHNFMEVPCPAFLGSKAHLYNSLIFGGSLTKPLLQPGVLCCSATSISHFFSS